MIDIRMGELHFYRFSCRSWCSCSLIAADATTADAPVLPKSSPFLICTHHTPPSSTTSESHFTQSRQSSERNTRLFCNKYKSAGTLLREDDQELLAEGFITTVQLQSTSLC